MRLFHTRPCRKKPPPHCSYHQRAYAHTLLSYALQWYQPKPIYVGLSHEKLVYQLHRGAFRKTDRHVQMVRTFDVTQGETLYAEQPS